MINSLFEFLFISDLVTLFGGSQKWQMIVLINGDPFYFTKTTFYCNNHISSHAMFQHSCMAQRPPTDVDWKAHKEIYEVWKKMKSNLGFNCCHVARTQNGLADILAKRGAKSGESYMGFTYPIFAE